jgi:uncharacterized protein YceK
MGDRGLLRTAFAAILALSLTGCGSIANFVPKDPPKEDMYCRIYGGVRAEAAALADPRRSSCMGFEEVAKFIVVLDFPFTLALDTATLPLTLVSQLFIRREAPPKRTDSPAVPPDDPK